MRFVNAHEDVALIDDFLDQFAGYIRYQMDWSSKCKVIWRGYGGVTKGLSRILVHHLC